MSKRAARPHVRVMHGRSFAMPGRGAGITGGGVAQRLRRMQERFEPLVTRVILGGIFVIGLAAQFVPSVGDAIEGKAYLGGALLSLVGYVL